MKTQRKLPCLPGFLAAGVIGSLALLPTYFYVRLLPFLVALVTVFYCLLSIWGQKKPGAAHVVRSLLTTAVILGVLVFAITGGLIFRAGLGRTDAECPYIVVLGAQVRDDGPSMSLRERIDAAYEYLTAHPDTVAIVSGGKGDDEPISEARCMYDELVKMGIAPERVIMEDQAASTWGNLSYSLDIIETRTGNRPSSVGVVSSEYHLFRTSLQAEEYGLEIIGIPAKTGSFDRWLHYFVREIAGVWHYILLGGQYA